MYIARWNDPAAAPAGEAGSVIIVTIVLSGRAMISTTYLHAASLHRDDILIESRRERLTAQAKHAPVNSGGEQRRPVRNIASLLLLTLLAGMIVAWFFTLA
ncbi:MAG: hypothetical protein U0031_03480 [Thermomicrobiales bacterium]